MTMRILIANIPAGGHIYPTLAMVGELARRGHEITYATVNEYAALVAQAGATPLAYPTVDPFAVVGGKDSDRAPLLFLEENLAILEAAEAHFADQAPDLVVYDGVAAQAGRILARAWGVPAVQLSPVFASNESYSYARAMMEAAGVGDAPPSEAIMQFGARMGELLASRGVEQSMQDFMMAVEDFNVVFGPRAFQPRGETFDERFAFVGPCLGERSFLGDWSPRDDGLPLALVSLGTSYNNDPEFFRTCARAFDGLPWRAVMSVGDGIDPDTLGPLPANVEVHRWVPHLKVLEHADLFVTHGGMGSVMEALHWGCPLLVVPPWPDVVPNADRIVELGLGTSLRPADLDVDLLRKQLVRTANDPQVRARVQDMRRHTREAGGAVRAADEIEAYAKRAV
ncbi:macrolide family glycosyltransferase [Streptomyces sp. NPDC058335]|uniref:macrolide family glycosyltransferase n=1 Tax=Streptomyces sp. NPDC058335 TaxID=3346451 RepID=UPI0036471D25